MIVYCNGRFLPEQEALISAFDRGFLYGDGLFESIRVYNGKLFRWLDHWARLTQGAAFLRMSIPLSLSSLLEVAKEVIDRNGLECGTLRVVLTRGVGARGYSIRSCRESTLVVSAHPATGPVNALRTWKLIRSRTRLAPDSLGQYKTCQKLPHILARAEAEEQSADEALLCNTNGHIAEASSCNIFWWEGPVLCTPPIRTGCVAGVTRSVILEICQRKQISVRQLETEPRRLAESAGAFLTMSSQGIIEISDFEGQKLDQSTQTQELFLWYQELLESGTAST